MSISEQLGAVLPIAMSVASGGAVFGSLTQGTFSPNAPSISAGTIIFVSILFHGCEGLRAVNCISSNDNYGKNIPYISTLCY